VHYYKPIVYFDICDYSPLYENKELFNFLKENNIKLVTFDKENIKIINDEFIMNYWELKSYLTTLTIKNEINKRFLCLNRRIHEFRNTLIGELYNQNLLDNFLLGFGRERSGKKQHFDYNNLKYITNNNYKNFEKQLPIILQNKVNNLTVEDIFLLKQDLFSKTQMSIVTETNFNFPILTEKTYLELSNNRPFIIAGGAYSLKKLHNKGFKTFSLLWDENYDLIEDHTKRLNAIVEVIRFLNNLDSKEFNNIIEKSKIISEYNKQICNEILQKTKNNFNQYIRNINENI
jgi:hypothetical protein